MEENKIAEIKELIKELNKATIAYDSGCPYLSDKEWDDLYFQLESLEKELGIIYPNSPTQKINYEIVSELPKAIHQYKPMLSLGKTKDAKEIESFCFAHKDYWDWFAMFKLDGLSCRLTYVNGKLIKGETRGNGEVGEDITHNIKVINNIPKTISTTEELVIIDGEILSAYDDFEKFKNEYKNPRNFAAGSIRLLDSKECARRNLSFVAWDLIKGCEDIDYNFHRLEKLDGWGFYTVPRVGDAETINDAIEALDEMKDYYLYPIDGYVFKFESKKFCDSLGRTDHHFNSAIAYKFYDEEYETRLKYINYDVSRNGVLTPVAVFDPIDIDGTTVERCSLFNLSVLEEKLGKPYVGQKIWVCKRNQIIPYIERAEKINDTK